MIGQLVGKYRLIESIGRGGLGEVFRAEHDLTGDVAAVKVFADADEQHLDDTFAQVRDIARVNHASIARVLDYGRLESGAGFIATELIEGLTLEALIDEGGRPLDECVEFAQQIASALAAIHEVGASHGCVGASNAFVVDDPTLGQERIKVVDCGLSVLANDGFEGSPASDVAALGELLYTLISGGEPGKEPIIVKAPHTPPRLVDLIDSMLAADPTERPEAIAVVGTLERVLDEFGEVATTDPSEERITDNDPPETALYSEEEPTVLDSIGLAPIHRANSESELTLAEETGLPAPVASPLLESPTIDDLAPDAEEIVDLPAPVLGRARATADEAVTDDKSLDEPSTQEDLATLDDDDPDSEGELAIVSAEDKRKPPPDSPGELAALGAKAKLEKPPRMILDSSPIAVDPPEGYSKPAEAHTAVDDDAPNNPELANMIEDSALGDDAPTMIVPAVIDAELLDERPKLPKPLPPEYPSIPSAISSVRGVNAPAAGNTTQSVLAGYQPWVVWAGVALAVVLILIVFVLARSCGDSGSGGPQAIDAAVDGP